MHNIEMHEMTEAFFPCWKAAGLHPSKQVDGGIRSWLRAHPYPPFLEHLSFRLGNQLFFVRIEDVDGKAQLPEVLVGLFLPSVLELEGASIASNGDGAAGADESRPSSSAAILPRSTVAAAAALPVLGDEFESPESPEDLECDDEDDD
jgi:hypothetical protein